MGTPGQAIPICDMEPQRFGVCRVVPDRLTTAGPVVVLADVTVHVISHCSTFTEETERAVWRHAESLRAGCGQFVPLPPDSHPYPSPRKEALVFLELSAASQSSVGDLPQGWAALGISDPGPHEVSSLTQDIGRAFSFSVFSVPISEMRDKEIVPQGSSCLDGPSL